MYHIHLCFRASEHFKNHREATVADTSLWSSSTQMCSQDNCPCPETGASSLLFTRRTPVLIQGVYPSCPHQGAQAPPQEIPTKCMEPTTSLTLLLHHPLLRESAQLSGGPNLDDTPHKKWGFPGSSCLKAVWLITEGSETDNSCRTQDRSKIPSRRLCPREQKCSSETARWTMLCLLQPWPIWEPQLGHLLLDVTLEGGCGPAGLAASKE